MSTRDKILLIISLAAVAGLMFWGRSCGIKSVTKATGSDTIIVTRTDTVKTNPEPDTIIQTVIKTRTANGEIVLDTLYVDTSYAAEPVPPTDTLKELTRLQGVEKKYNQKVFYKDSAEGSNWKVVLADEVYQNKLKKPRQWVVTKKDTLIENTTVLKPPRNLVLYFVASAMGNRHEPLGGAGAGLGLKLPNDRVFIVQWKTIRNNQPMIEATYLAPLRNPFKKKK